MEVPRRSVDVTFWFLLGALMSALMGAQGVWSLLAGTGVAVAAYGAAMIQALLDSAKAVRSEIHLLRSNFDAMTVNSLARPPATMPPGLDLPALPGTYSDPREVTDRVSITLASGEKMEVDFDPTSANYLRGYGRIQKWPGPRSVLDLLSRSSSVSAYLHLEDDEEGTNER